MVYSVESVDFYRQLNWLNQSENIGYVDLSLKLHVKHAGPIDIDQMAHPLVTRQTFK